MVQPESNSRPPAWQPDARPTEPPVHRVLVGHSVLKIVNSKKESHVSSGQDTILSIMFSKYCSLAVKLSQFAFVQGDAFSSWLWNWFILKNILYSVLLLVNGFPKIWELLVTHSSTNIRPHTGCPVCWASGWDAGDCEFDSSRTAALRVFE